MKTRKFHALCALTLLALSMVTPWSASQANAQSLASIHGPGTIPVAAIGANESFMITFTTALCRETNEYMDETYFIFAVIRPGGLFGTPGMDIFGTHVHYNIHDGTTVQSNTPLLNRHVESDVAVVAITVEHDSSSVNDVKANVRLFAQVAFETAIQSGETNVWTLSGLVGPAMEGGVDSVARPFVDDDDRIGSAQRFLVTTATFDDLAVGQVSRVARNSHGDDASYDLNFEITRTR